MGRGGMGQTLQPTALVHEAWLRLSKGERRWNGVSHFCAAAAETMRHILIDRARERSRLKRWGGQERVPMCEADDEAVAADEKTLLIDEALELLKKNHPLHAEVVLLKFPSGFRGGCREQHGRSHASELRAAWDDPLGLLSAAGSAAACLRRSATVPVSGLYLGGVEQGLGVYHQGNSGGFIRGLREIEVIDPDLPPPLGDVPLTRDDPGGTSSMFAAGGWSNGAAPSPANRYSTGNFTLRTPLAGGDYEFMGTSLSVDPSGRLIGKVLSANSVQTIRIPKRILNGGLFDQSDNGNSTARLVIEGEVWVKQTSVIGGAGDLDVGLLNSGENTGVA